MVIFLKYYEIYSNSKSSKCNRAEAIISLNILHSVLENHVVLALPYVPQKEHCKLDKINPILMHI